MKKLYLAIETDTTIHMAWTKYNPDEYVKIDLTRDQAFKLYDGLSQIILFEKQDEARSYALDQYIKQKAKETKDLSFGLFMQSSVETYRSTDKALLSTYGKDMVIMKKTHAPVFYEVEVSDDSILHKQTAQESKETYQASFSVNIIDKSKIKLNYAQTYTALYATDEFAKTNKLPSTTIDLVDKSRSVVNSCVIL